MLSLAKLANCRQFPKLANKMFIRLKRWLTKISDWFLKLLSRRILDRKKSMRSLPSGVVSCLHKQDDKINKSISP